MAFLTERFRNEFQDHGAIGPCIHSIWLATGAATRRIVTTFSVWQERAFQRRQLLALNDRALKDIGRTRADAACEGGKPFWRA